MKYYDCGSDFVIGYEDYNRGIALLFDNTKRNDMTKWFATKEEIKNLISFLQTLVDDTKETS